MGLIANGMVKGGNAGGEGDNFFIGGLDEGMYNTGGLLLFGDWYFIGDGELPVEGGEFLLFVVRSTGSIWSPGSPSGIWYGNLL